MKKKSWIIKVLLIIGIVIISGITFIIVKNNKYDKKEILKTENFIETMKSLNFEIEDTTSEYNNKEIESVIIAYKENKYEIGYLIFTNNKIAKNYFFRNKNYFDENKGNKYIYSFISFNSYSKYKLTANEKYIELIRLKNSALYINVDKKYKEEIKNIIKKLDY